MDAKARTKRCIDDTRRTNSGIGQVQAPPQLAGLNAFSVTYYVKRAHPSEMRDFAVAVQFKILTAHRSRCSTLSRPRTAARKLDAKGFERNRAGFSSTERAVTLKAQSVGD